MTERPAGKGTAYNFKGGNGVWYGCGFKKPPFTKGDTITFTATENGKYWNCDLTTVQIVNNPEVISVTKAVATDKEKYWEQKDHQIAIAGARNSAIAFCNLAHTTGALVLPKTQAKQLEALEEYVFHYTSLFFTQTATLTDEDLEVAGFEKDDNIKKTAENF